jgi:hypothetical protein
VLYVSSCCPSTALSSRSRTRMCIDEVIEPLRPAAISSQTTRATADVATSLLERNSKIPAVATYHGFWRTTKVQTPKDCSPITSITGRFGRTSLSSPSMIPWVAILLYRKRSHLVSPLQTDGLASRVHERAVRAHPIDCMPST